MTENSTQSSAETQKPAAERVRKCKHIWKGPRMVGGEKQGEPPPGVATSPRGEDLITGSDGKVGWVPVTTGRAIQSAVSTTACL